MEPSGRSTIRVDCDLTPLAEEIARRVAQVIANQLTTSDRLRGWKEAIAYTRIPEATFRKWVAEGRIPSNGGKRRLFHRGELDTALGYAGTEEPAMRHLAAARRRT